LTLSGAFSFLCLSFDKTAVSIRLPMSNLFYINSSTSYLILGSQLMILVEISLTFFHIFHV
jgi:hypothetical protein